MKKLIGLALLFVLALPFSVEAHTTLTSSTPTEGEMVTEPLEEIQLVFGTAIEQGSEMTLQGEEAAYEIESIEITDNTMTGVISEELPNGAYMVQWNIIGEDGHPIEGEFSFGVDIETTEEEPVAEEPTAEEPTADNETNAEETAQTTESSESGGNLFVTILIAAAAVLLIAGLYGLLKKKS